MSDTRRESNNSKVELTKKNKNYKRRPEVIIIDTNKQKMTQNYITWRILTSPSLANFDYKITGRLVECMTGKMIATPRVPRKNHIWIH